MIRILLIAFLSAGLQAQTPLVGDINLYGLRRTSADKVLATLNVKPGDPLPPSKGDLEDRLETLPNVVLARVTAVCCEGGKAMLFAGVEEKGAAHFALRSAPSGDVVLPEDFTTLYRRLLEAVESAVRRGSTAEDLTQGHALMADPAARAVELEIAAWVKDHLALTRDILRNASDEDQRAIAAAIIGYAPDKKAVLDDLQFAMQDPDEAVRANAMRSMTAVAVLAAKNPDQNLKLSPTWFAEMLNSIVLSDRLKATEALITLSESRPPELLQLLRERALPALTEMARWNSLRYALPPFILLGRVAGLSEDDIQARWKKGEREQVIGNVLGPKPRRK